MDPNLRYQGKRLLTQLDEIIYIFKVDRDFIYYSHPDLSRGTLQVSHGLFRWWLQNKILIEIIEYDEKLKDLV